MLSAAKQRRGADLPGRMRESLERDQRNESALADKAAEDIPLYFFHSECKKMTCDGVEKCHNVIGRVNEGTVVAP